MFRDHPMLKLIYEDLAGNPQRVAERAAEFLGLPQRLTPPTVKSQKTGADDLSQALIGFDDLRAHVRRWASFFES
jgi:hypothetical protein